MAAAPGQGPEGIAFGQQQRPHRLDHLGRVQTNRARVAADRGPAVESGRELGELAAIDQLDGPGADPRSPGHLLDRPAFLLTRQSQPFVRHRASCSPVYRYVRYTFPVIH